MAKADFSPIQIDRIALDAVHFERPESPPESGQEGFAYELDLGIKAVRDDEEKPRAAVQVDLAVDWDEQPGPFALSLTYTAYVRHDGSVDDDTFAEISRTRLSSTLLGFARPFVARLMSEANESFRLPMIDLRNHPVDEPPE